jgi:hypothetical protein
VLASREDRVAHRTGGCFRERLSVTTQFFDFLANNFGELEVGIFLGGTVADASPREEVRV